MSFDLFISFIGGYMNIVYVTLYSLTIVYRNFNLDQSLLKKIYSFDGRDEIDEPCFENDMILMRHRVEQKKPFLMTFRRYCCSTCLNWFCCCIKNANWINWRRKELRYREELVSRLNYEVDILEMIRIIR